MQKNIIVLVVDDNRHSRIFTGAAIREVFGDDVTIIEAEGVKEARAILASRNDIDLVMLDYTMNGGNGNELIADIRDSQTESCVIAATSTHPPHNEELMGMERGADTSVPKSILNGDEHREYEKLLELVRGRMQKN